MGRLITGMSISRGSGPLGMTFPLLKTDAIVKEEIKHGEPQGMQGFFMNARRDLFKDVRVRHALAYAFDFPVDECEHVLWAVYADEELLCEFRAGFKWGAGRAGACSIRAV